ncbi:MAG: hypothetical protein ACFCU8_17250 [Thermosynechococcaceae cyanobacterium]
MGDNGKRWTGVMWLKRLMLMCAVGLLAIASGNAISGTPDAGLFSKFQANPSTKIVEVSPSETIQALRSALDSRQPHVKILSPRSEEVVQDNRVKVKLQVEDLPIFKDEDFGLGPHLHLFVDDQPYSAIYDIDEPWLLEDLEPGTHTLRVLAAYPWFESFKNQNAYAHVTFHVFTKTNDNHPNTTQRLLTYNQPQDVYDAEPVMLDFFISGEPAAQKPTSAQVRVTINDTSFLVNGEKTLYLSGFKPGKNWVRLELLDDQGRAVDNIYNAPVRLVDLRDNAPAPLAQINQGSLTAAKVRGIVDPNYVPEPAVLPVVPALEPITDPTGDSTEDISTETKSTAIAPAQQEASQALPENQERESRAAQGTQLTPETLEPLKGNLSVSDPASPAQDGIEASPLQQR